jgi:hypothetical protein
MLDTRRRFLLAIAVTSLSVGAWGQLPPPPKPGSGAVPKSPEREESDPLNAANPTKAMLEANDKEMKKKVEKLYQLAGELKETVEKTDSARVLSIDMVKKAEEIEKLAREIKTRSKG